MKSFKFNRKKEDLLPVMKAKAEKANIKMTKEKDKISLMLETGKFQNGEDAVPVIFKGKITNTETGCTFDGKYTYGFYLYTLVIVAAILIVARFSWSAYQHQMDNMILCGIVTVLLIGLIVVVTKKSKGGKKVIENLLNRQDCRSAKQVTIRRVKIWAFET